MRKPTPARRQEESLGSYLRSIRRLRGLRVEDIAAQAGVSEAKWDFWESNSQTPSAQELDELVRLLELSAYKQERLAHLAEMAPRRVLRDLSRSRLSALAAAGKAVVDPRLEWEALDAVVQDRLKAWARDKDLELPRELLSFIATLGTDDEVEDWLAEVFPP